MRKIKRIVRKDVKINFGRRPETTNDFREFYKEAKGKYRNIIKKYYKMRFDLKFLRAFEPDKSKSIGRNFVYFKQKAIEESLLNRRVEESKYSLSWGCIYNYLLLNNKYRKLVSQWNVKNNKGGINALSRNLLATGGGFFLIQQFWRERRKREYFFNKRSNYFFCGWTEEGFLFAHPVTGQAVSKALHQEKWWEYILNYIWSGRLNKLTYRQGEWGLIKVKKVPDVYVETDTYKKGNHIFENMIVFSDGKRMYALSLKGAKLKHKTGRHKDVNVEEGVYEIITTKESDIWDFGVKID